MKNDLIQILFFMMLCVITPLFAQTPRTVSGWMELADNEPDPQKALTYYQQVLNLKSDGPIAAEALNGSAILLAGPQMRELAKAISFSNRAIAMDSTKAKYYVQRAYTYVELNDYLRAEKDYKKAVRMAPKHGDYYSGLSYCQFKNGRFDEAEAAAQKGINLDPKSPYAYRNRGRAKLRRGQADEAIADFQICIDLNHTQLFRVYCDLAEAYEQKGDFQNALKFFSQSVQTDPNYYDAMIGKKNLEEKLKIAALTSPPVNATFAGSRVALVVGNSEYKTARKLQGQPVNDAKAMQTRLLELGFDTLSAINADTEETFRKLDAFYEKAKKSDVALVFYAGHGIHYNGENYLLPVDVPRTKSPGFAEKAISVTTLIDRLQKQTPGFCVIIMDACREDPYFKSESDSVATKAFKKVYVENQIPNCYVALSTSENGFSYNSPKNNGFYTSSLLKNLKKGARMDEVFRIARGEVMDEAVKFGSKQEPVFDNRARDILIL